MERWREGATDKGLMEGGEGTGEEGGGSCWRAAEGCPVWDGGKGQQPYITIIAVGQ